MRAAIFLLLLTATVILIADGPGVTSRVRISADRSNRDWEQNFFGDRLRAMHKRGETPDELVMTDDDAIVPEKNAAATPKKPAIKGKRTVEFHIVQEESEEGDSSRKVKKRVIIEQNKPDAPAPRQ